MNKTISIVFDFLRSLAALCVVYHHYNSISELPYRVFPDIGQEAVMVFFVLSGYIMAWVVEQRDKSFLDFFIKRLSRIYSVLLPSLILAIIAYSITQLLDPTTFSKYGSLSELGTKIFLTITFTNYNSIIHGVSLAAMPVWSLTYEFWYYIIFAIASFLPSHPFKYFAIAIIFCFLGPEPLLFLPIWWLGVLLYKNLRKFHFKPSVNLLIFLLSLFILIGLNLSGIKDALTLPSIWGIPLNRAFFHSQYFIYFYLIGLCISLNLFSLISWLNTVKLTVGTKIEKSIQHVAQTSFVIYLLHTALMLLMKAILRDNAFLYLIPTLTAGLLILIGKPIEDSKKHYRRIFSQAANSITQSIHGTKLHKTLLKWRILAEAGS